MTPIRKARADRLGRLGLSAAKIKTLKNIARELAAERLNLDVLAEEDADAAHHTLTALHGIGPWTADVYLLFCLGHGDAWPAGDIAIQEAIKVGLGLPTRPTAKQMAPLAEPWRPLRGAAAHLWWSYYRVLKKREGVLADKLSPAAHPVLARGSRDEIDHRAHRREFDEIRMRQQPEVGHADQLLWRDANEIRIGGGDRSRTASRSRGPRAPRRSMSPCDEHRITTDPCRVIAIAPARQPLVRQRGRQSR